MSQDTDDLFSGLDDAKVPGRSYADKLPVGTHTLMLKKFGIKKARKPGLKVVEGEYLVLESTDASVVDETRGWAWFLGRDENGMQEGYLKQFAEAVAKCTESKDSPSKTIGVLTDPKQNGRGLMIKAIVKNQTDKNGKIKCDGDGQPYTETRWYPIAQSLADVAEGRAVLDADPKHAAENAVASTRKAAETVADKAVEKTEEPAAPKTGGVSALLKNMRKGA